MAKLVLTNSVVTLNGTDISNDVAAITLSTSAAEVPTTLRSQWRWSVSDSVADYEANF